MEVAILLPQDSISSEEGKVPGVPKPKEETNRRRKTLPPARSGTSRTTLSDVSNLPSNGRPPRLGAEAQGSEKIVQPASSDEYVPRLIKENSTLSKLLGERNSMIEMNSIELQKLRITLQKANQQNWQLVQKNSQMLAELNLGKERVKALQHELGCMTAMLKVKTSEMKELKRLNKQPKQPEHKMDHQIQQKSESTESDSNHPASEKKVHNLRKRPLRSQSLAPSSGAHVLASKEKDECRRRSLRRRSINLKSELCQSTKDLFEIEDIKLPIRSPAGEAVHQEKSLASAHPVSSTSLKSVKVESQEESSSSKDQRQGPGRSSTGRPIRRAAEKVTCYKETPLGLKMRRDQ